jgi:TonB family protein
MGLFMKWDLRKCIGVSALLHLLIFWGAASLSGWGGPKTIYRPQYSVRLVGMEEIEGKQKGAQEKAESAQPSPPVEKPEPKPEPKKPEVQVPEKKAKEEPTKTAPALDKEKQKAPPPEPVKTAAKEKSPDQNASAEKQTAPEETLDEILSKIQKKVASRGGAVGAGARSSRGSGWEDRQAELAFNAYYDEVERRVRQNWIPPQNFDPRRESLMTVVSLVLLPDGRVQTSYIEQSSGNPYFDQSVMRAIFKSDPFPPPPVGLTKENFELGLRFHSSPVAQSPW